MYFWFMDDVMFAHNGQKWVKQKRHILKVTQQGQHRFDSTEYTQTDPLGGSTRAGAESDIYDCLVVTMSTFAVGSYEDSVDNTVENSSAFSLRACGQ